MGLIIGSIPKLRPMKEDKKEKQEEKQEEPSEYVWVKDIGVCKVVPKNVFKNLDAFLKWANEPF